MREVPEELPATLRAEDLARRLGRTVPAISRLARENPDARVIVTRSGTAQHHPHRGPRRRLVTKRGDTAARRASVVRAALGVIAEPRRALVDQVRELIEADPSGFAARRLRLALEELASAMGAQPLAETSVSQRCPYTGTHCAASVCERICHLDARRGWNSPRDGWSEPQPVYRRPDGGA